MLILIMFVLGICLGSFVNALVWRVYKQEHTKNKRDKAKYSISQGRSMCPNCKHTLAAKDLIPVISWLVLKGKCRYCRKNISWQYPAVELLTAILFLVSYYSWPYALNGLGATVFALWLILLTGLIALAVYDLKWFILPNRIVFPLFGITGIYLLLRLIINRNDLIPVLGSSMWGLLIGGGIFWILFQVSNGKWIGGGDVKLGWLLGIIVGGPLASLLLIFIASLLGTFAAMPLIYKKKLGKQHHVPFGPFLIAACVIVLLVGGRMITWYKTQLGV